MLDTAKVARSGLVVWIRLSETREEDDFDARTMPLSRRAKLESFMTESRALSVHSEWWFDEPTLLLTRVMVRGARGGE